jgi:hypothetical protein
MQRVTSLSKNICLCSYILISHLQLDSDNGGSILQPLAWFPMVSYFRQGQCSTMIAKQAMFGRLIAGNTERFPLCNCL